MYSNDDFALCPEADSENMFDRLFGDRENVGGTCDGCGKGERETSWGLVGYPIAMVYSTLQNFDELYDKDKALTRGTIFKELDLPFLGALGGSQCNICGGIRND